MNVKGSIVAMFTLAVLAITGSCTLDNPEPSPFNFPVQLNAVKEYSLITLNWTPVKVTEFKEYIILQSAGEIPDEPEPVVNASVTVLKRIDDADITTLPTSDILFSPRVCYKLYVSLTDRFLQSPNICVDQNITQINGFYDRAGHEPGLNEAVVFDRLEQRLSLLDHTQGIITKTVTTFDFSFPIMEIHVRPEETNVFAYESSPARLFKYTYPGLSAINSKFFGGVLFAILPFEQFVFAASDEPGKSLKVFNSITLSERDSYPGSFGNRNLAAFAGDPVILLDMNDEAIVRYAVSTNGELTLLDSKTPGIILPSQQNFTALSSQLFVGGRLGEIIDREGNRHGSLSTGLQAFVSMARFSPDEQKVVYMINENNEMRIDVSDVSNLQLIRKIASIKIPFTTYADMIVEEDVITVIGVSFDSGQAQTFILKYPMP